MKEPTLHTKHGVLFSADCLEILSSLKDDSVDCIFADPPFNLGKDYRNGYKDDLSNKDYYEWSKMWINECARVLKPGGSFFIYALPEHNIKFGNYLNEVLSFRHWIAITMKGSFRRGKKLYPAHYGILYYTKGEPKTFNKLRVPIPVCRHCGKQIRDYGGYKNKMNPAGLNLSDFWDDTSPNRHKKYKVRPGVNELKLMIPERAILLSTEPGDIVLDPFGGGGSTYEAAEKNHRNWIGIELYDSKHIEKRMKENFPDSFGKSTGFNYKELFKTYENNEDKVLRRSTGQSMQTRNISSLSGASEDTS